MEDRERWDFIKPIRAEDEKIFHRRRGELRFYTRISCHFPAVVTVFIMYHLFMKLTHMKLLAFSGTVLYLSIPQVFVRSSYAGYYALTNFFLVIIAYFFFCFSEEERKEKGLRFPLFLASVLLALTNHKGLLIIPALLFHQLLKSVFEHRRRGFFKAIREWGKSALGSRIVLGAVTGAIIFWVYGCSIDHENFFKDHIGYDFLERFNKEGIRFTEDGSYLDRYPSVLGLWKEFNRSTGIAFLPLSLLSILYVTRRITRREAFLFFWFLIGAVGFSVVDWKQTKHLMLILLPLLVSIVIFIHERGKTGRLTLLAVIAFIVIVNTVTVYRMSQYFKYLTISPEW